MLKKYYPIQQRSHVTDEWAKFWLHCFTLVLLIHIKESISPYSCWYCTHFLTTYFFAELNKNQALICHLIFYTLSGDGITANFAKKRKSNGSYRCLILQIECCIFIIIWHCLHFLCIVCVHFFSPREPDVNHLLDNRRQRKPYDLNP